MILIKEVVRPLRRVRELSERSQTPRCPFRTSFRSCLMLNKLDTVIQDKVLLERKRWEEVGLLSMDVGGNKVLQASSIHVPKLNFTEKD